MAEGRMIRKVVARSRKIAELKNDKARILYFMIYPHVDIEGRHSADPYDIKAGCIPLFDWLISEIEQALQDLFDSELILMYRVDNRKYLQITRFHDFQVLRRDREAISKIPSPPRVLPENSRTSTAISKVKISKDNKEPGASPVLKDLLNKINTEGFNIYRFLGKMKRIPKISWIPDEVLIKVCEGYLKNINGVKDRWPWFARAVKSEWENYNANKNIAEGAELKKAPVPEALLALVRSIGK